MLSAGTNVEWLVDDLGILDSAAASDALAASVPDAGGVAFVPALLGVRVGGEWVGVLAGAAAMLGHARPVFLGFGRGGNSRRTRDGDAGRGGGGADAGGGVQEAGAVGDLDLLADRVLDLRNFLAAGRLDAGIDLVDLRLLLLLLQRPAGVTGLLKGRSAG